MHLVSFLHFAESVIVSPDGVATMLDKFGAVWEAEEGPDGSLKLRPQPRAWLGPGRPLGAGFDAQGNLYVCDALKVNLDEPCLEQVAATQLQRHCCRLTSSQGG